MAQRNLNFLIQAIIERDEQKVKRSTPAKEKDVALTKGSSAPTRRSDILMK
jgi:hypothetical protein